MKQFCSILMSNILPCLCRSVLLHFSIFTQHLLCQFAKTKCTILWSSFLQTPTFVIQKAQTLTNRAPQLVLWKLELHEEMLVSFDIGFMWQKDKFLFWSSLVKLCKICTYSQPLTLLFNFAFSFGLKDCSFLPLGKEISPRPEELMD